MSAETTLDPRSPAPMAAVPARRTGVNPWTWQEGMGYSQGVHVVGGQQTLFVAGQTSIDADGEIVHIGDMAGQVGQALDNVAAVLAQAGFTFADVVRYDVHTTDADAYLAASSAVAERFGGWLPAGGILCQVARLAMPPLLVEITVTAAR